MAEIISTMNSKEEQRFNQMKMGMDKEHSLSSNRKEHACMENTVPLGLTVQYKQVVGHENLKLYS